MYLETVSKLHMYPQENDENSLQRTENTTSNEHYIW